MHRHNLFQGHSEHAVGALISKISFGCEGQLGKTIRRCDVVRLDVPFGEGLFVIRRSRGDVLNGVAKALELEDFQASSR